MSESVAQSISGTGKFRIPELPTRAAEMADDGNTETGAGKPLPQEVEKPDLAVIAEELNISTQAIGRDLRFEVNLESGRSVIQVLDRETGEIIRQIPPEDVAPYRAENGGLALRLLDELA